MIFKRKKILKEYMKYENGKIVKTDYNNNEDQDKKIQNEDAIQSNQTKPKQFSKGTLLKYFNLLRNLQNYTKEELIKKLLLPCSIAVVIIGITIYIISDLYFVFFKELPNVQDTSTKPGIINEIPQEDKSTDSTYDNSIDETNQPNVFNDSNTSEGKDLIESQSQDPVMKILEVTSNINKVSLIQSNKEITKVQEFVKGKTNKVVLQNLLNNTLSLKKKYYSHLTLSKEYYEVSDASNLYKATENRLLNAIDATDALISYINNISHITSLQIIIDDYVESDMVLQELQNDEFINILKINNIEYSINDETSAIIYEIK